MKAISWEFQNASVIADIYEENKESSEKDMYREKK